MPLVAGPTLADEIVRTDAPPIVTKNFTGPFPRFLTVSMAELIWAAVTVGATPISWKGQPWPLVELCWCASVGMA